MGPLSIEARADWGLLVRSFYRRPALNNLHLSVLLHSLSAPCLTSIEVAFDLRRMTLQLEASFEKTCRSAEGPSLFTAHFHGSSYGFGHQVYVGDLKDYINVGILHSGSKAQGEKDSRNHDL